MEGQGKQRLLRYLGHDEGPSSKDVNPDEILKKIQSDAKARKKSLDAVKIPTDAGQHVLDKVNRNKVDEKELKESPGKQSPRKRKKVSLNLEDFEESGETDDLEKGLTKVKEKKQKKRKKDEDDNEIKSENDTIGSPGKKTKRDNKTTGGSEVDIKSKESIAPDKDTGGKGKKKKHTKKLHIEGPTELGGFTVLGSHKPAELPKVARVLPDWLSHPTEISSDLSENLVPVHEMPGLCDSLTEKLHKNGIKHFFPVQQQVIPALLQSCQSGFHVGPAGYRPSDICVSAPTGSGKTLAFVIPIVQALQTRVTCQVRALAVLPVQDLAKQVFQVFQSYCQDTCLKVGLLTGQQQLSVEQKKLVKRRLRGYMSQYDILVATPGRLVDHINQTQGFDLSHLRYLVIDEADRMMDEIKQDWLIQVENAVYKCRPRPGPITAVSCRSMDTPLQKLLYSATLSQNPEKLQQLNLFQPKLFTSVNKSQPDKKREVTNKGDKSSDLIDNAENPAITGDDDDDADYIGKYTTPDTLTELTIKTELSEKPLIVLHMLHNLKYRNILCFTNSVESTHRLYLLVKAYGDVEVRQFSSGLKVARRNEILQHFMAGKIDIIICSDAMARGMDISNVNYVVNYDAPSHIQNYIHRIGRTARAGKQGSAFTLLQEKEFFHFKKMLREAGKKPLKEMKITRQELKPLIPKYETCLKEVSTTLEEGKKKKKFFKEKEKKRQSIDKEDIQDIQER